MNIEISSLIWKRDVGTQTISTSTAKPRKFSKECNLLVTTILQVPYSWLACNIRQFRTQDLPDAGFRETVSPASGSTDIPGLETD